MREIASAEIFALVQELSGKLKGKRLNNFYDLGSGSFRLDFEAGMSVFIMLTKTINETKLREEADAATPFAIAVRKRIKGSRLAELKQIGSERIVVFEFLGSERHSLVVEMFAKGNVIVLDMHGNIELAYATRHFRDRDIAPRLHYSFPSSDSLPFVAFSREALGKAVSKALSQEGVKLIAALSKFVNIGPIYLEELLVSCGLDPNAEPSSAADKAGLLVGALIKFGERMGKPMPIAYYLDSKPVNYAIMPIRKYASYKHAEFQSMSELLDSIYAIERARISDEEAARKAEELRKSIEEQQRLAREYSEKARLYRNIANKIYEHMSGLNEAIREAKAGAREGNAAPAHAAVSDSGISIVGIDKKAKTLHVVLE
ncbi:MAG: NFACT family protein [Candidatus Micrarchaeaceae archaeon]